MKNTKLTQYITINPANGQKLNSYKLNSSKDAQMALEKAVNAQLTWKLSTPKEKSALLLKLAHSLRANSDEVSRLMALEMGKPLHQGLSEIEKCAITCEYFAKNHDRLLRAQMDLKKNDK